MELIKKTNLEKPTTSFRLLKVFKTACLAVLMACGPREEPIGPISEQPDLPTEIFLGPWYDSSGDPNNRLVFYPSVTLPNALTVVGNGNYSGINTTVRTTPVGITALRDYPRFWALYIEGENGDLDTLKFSAIEVGISGVVTQ